MPVCLKCGKAIEKGSNYCDDCTELGEAQVQRMFDLVNENTYKRRRPFDLRWLLAGTVLILGLVVGSLYFVLTSLPTGPEFQAKIQAGLCKSNMRGIEEQVDRYFEVEGEYPPAGKIDADHPLVVDRYIEDKYKCPVTKRYYLLEKTDSGLVVVCDSELEGHGI